MRNSSSAAQEPTLASGLMTLKEDIMADQAFVDRIRQKYAIRNTHGYRLDAFLDGETPLEIFRRLLISSEGTLGFVADVTFETIASAPVTSVAWLAFPSIDAAIALVPELVELGAQAVELMVVPALRAAAEAFPGTPDYWRTLDPNAAALLVVAEHGKGLNMAPFLAKKCRTCSPCASAPASGAPWLIP